MSKAEACSFKFNNHVVGFFWTSERTSIIDELKEDLGLDADRVESWTSQEAEKVVAPFGESCGPFTQIKRFFQRAIGGGPSEFMRDVCLMSESRNKCLISVLVKDEATKNQVAEIMHRHRGERVKYFHPMYVEHLTLEKGHEQISLVEEQDHEFGHRRSLD